MGRSHVVRFLIETDPSADHLDMKDTTGRTALACAVEGRKTVCAALLCEAGASGAEKVLQREKAERLREKKEKEEEEAAARRGEWYIPCFLYNPYVPYCLIEMCVNA
jgi:hypothetical protein